ncbi:MAG: LytTR family DNA-binding domain-containing protein [Firmicutes bacterium]|nr:LytTR family DNA-binding domain-containing protein [Bacillota bacterium]
MLKIAICDDDFRELSRISDLLSLYKTEKNAVLKYDAFSSAVELLEVMKRQTYDVVLLDVLMPGMSGITAAHEIRGFDPSVKIIFLTSSPEFAVESYAVDAHYYLLKPGTADKLFPVLDRILLEKGRAEETLSIMQPSCLIRLPIGRIEFLEVYGKRLMFHFDDGNIKEIRGSISEFEDKLLCKDNFLKVHRSFIMNMEYIQVLNARDITTLAKQTVPVSRLLHSRVKEAYMQFLFVEKGVE